MLHVPSAFLGAMTKYLIKISLRDDFFLSFFANYLKEYGLSWSQELEVAGHIASVVRKQGGG